MTHRKPSLVDTAWIAGMFEGEGHITIKTQSGPRPYIHLVVGVTSTDFDVIERFHAIVGFGHVRLNQRKVKPHHKDQKIWEASKHDEVVTFLTTILPFLGARRTARAYEAFAAYKESRAALVPPRRPCANCGDDFQPPHWSTWKKYCGPVCQKAAHREQIKTRKQRIRLERNAA